MMAVDHYEIGTLVQIQVLNIMQGGSDDDSSTDDESYRHLYAYKPRTPEELAQDPMQWPVAADNGPSASPPMISRARSSNSGRPATTFTCRSAPNAAPLDPGDPVVPWRLAVEETLGLMATSTSAFASSTGPAQRDAMTELLRHTTALGSHVEHMRKQPKSSRCPLIIAIS